MASTGNSSRPIFYLIAALIPIGFLLLIEVLLRTVGYGQQYPLFIDVESKPGWQMPNPDVVKRYFHSPELAPKVGPDTFLFRSQKPKDSLRIVVMGGSSAAGFPYGRFGSPAGMLSQQLKARYPERDIEVISVAMASINSYALRDFSREVIDINPDIIMLYAGHNEFLGVMGVGSVFSGAGGHFANLMLMKFRDLRLFQLVQSVITSSPEPAENHAKNRTVMATVAREKNIPYGSDLYYAGVTQFERNLDSLLAQFNDANVPVFIGTLVSNESHQSPFASESKADDQERSANYHYALGQDAYEAKQFQDALHAFTKARDLDLLRFRAPSEFNDVIRLASQEYDAFLVDVEQTMRNDTQTGIIGQYHMLEHLHPTARGYHILTTAYVDAMIQAGMLPPSTTDKETLWQQIPLTAVEHQLAAYKVAQLTSDYPFTDQSTGFQLSTPKNPIAKAAQSLFKGEDWLSIQQNMLTGFQKSGQLMTAATVASVLFEALQTNEQAANAAAQLYRQAQQLTLAQYHARKATELAPNNISYRLNRAQIYYLLGDRDSATQQLEKVLSIEPNNQQAKRYLQLIQ